MKIRLLAIFIFISVCPCGMSCSIRPAVQPHLMAEANQRTPTPTPTPDKSFATAGRDTSSDDGEVIKVNTQLVSIPVRVLDKKNRFIGGMTKENFKIYEDDVEQDVALFSNEHEPFTVALLLDMSYSSTFKIADIQSAAIAFIDQLGPQDRLSSSLSTKDIIMSARQQVTMGRSTVRSVQRSRPERAHRRGRSGDKQSSAASMEERRSSCSGA